MTPAYHKYINLNRLLHAGGKAHPGRTRRYYWYLKQIVDETNSKTLLDWGCGKAKQWHYPLVDVPDNPMLQEYLGLSQVTCYDPAVDEFSRFPTDTKHDIAICVDVLSLIPELDLPWVFSEIRKRCEKAAFFVVQSDVVLSKKKYADGSLKQVTQKPRQWWIDYCGQSTDWSGISVYWKWCEDGRSRTEQLLPVNYTK